MAWYDRFNPGNWDVGGDVKWGLNKLGLYGNQPSDQAKIDNLNSVGAAGMGFAGDARGNYGALTGRLNGSLDYLQGQMQGRNSVSAEQLRQGMQQNVAAQRSMAASASPNDASIAAFNAGNNIARLGYGLTGQQAMAGIAERNAAAAQYASLLGAARGQDVQATLGGYNAAGGAYGGGLNAQRDPTLVGQLAPMIMGAAKFGGSRR